MSIKMQSKRAGKKSQTAVGTPAQPKKKSRLGRATRGTLLAVGLTAAQLGDETALFGDKIFRRNPIDRLRPTVTRYHE